MSIGAAPNLSGGLWMSGMSDSALSMGNGNAPTGQNFNCGGGNAGGKCSISGGGNGAVSALDTSPGVAGNSGGGYFSGSGYQDSGMGQPGSDVTSFFAQAYGSPAAADSCSPPPGPTPPEVATGAGNCIIIVTCPSYSAQSLPITCQETGMTMNLSDCEAHFENVPFVGEAPFTFSTPGGFCNTCPSEPVGRTFGSGSVSCSDTGEEAIEVDCSGP